MKNIIIKNEFSKQKCNISSLLLTMTPVTARVIRCTNNGIDQSFQLEKLFWRRFSWG